MDSLNKLRIIDSKSIDKSSVYIAVDSNSWRSPAKISLSDLIYIDPSSLNITILPSKQSFFCEPFIDHDRSYYRLPQNATEIGAVHAAVDDNYLYIWIETQKKWKRVPLSDWT